MMRNMDVVRLVETVNEVLQTGVIDSSQLDHLEKWSQMGVEELGGTPYRIALVLVNELRQARAGGLRMDVFSSQLLEGAQEEYDDDNIPTPSVDDNVPVSHQYEG